MKVEICRQGKWYEAYYTKIDLAAVHRLTGYAKVTLDLVESTWSVFVESLLALFTFRGGLK